MNYDFATELLCVAIILTALYFYLVSGFSYWRIRGVKGPSPVPIFGNFKDVTFGKVPMHKHLKRIYDSFPNERLIGLFAGSKPVLIVKDLDLVKDVLIKDFPLFADRGLQVDDEVDIFGSSIFSAEPDRWRPLRNKLSPVFSSGKLKDMFYLLLDCSERFEKYLDKCIGQCNILDVRQICSKFTANVIGTCIFGLDLETLDDDDCEFLKMSRRVLSPGYKGTITELLKRYSPWLYKKIGKHFIDTECRDYFIKIVMDNLRYRKEHKITRHDFVDVLLDLKEHPEKVPELDLTDKFIVAQAVVFFVAGFHSSSMTIAQCLYELARHPDIQEKLRKEIREELEKTNGTIDYHHINNIKLLDGVFKETLRKYPSLIFLVRQAARNYRFTGTNVVIPKGQMVWIPSYSIQNDANIHPDPEVFDPQRFIGDGLESARPMGHIPFGDGPRNCVGARFAVYQVKVGIMKVLLNYNVEMCEKTKLSHGAKVKQFVLIPDSPIYLRLNKIK